MNNSFTRYLLVGSINFLLDLMVLELLARAGIPNYIARILSMAAAFPIMFIIHRRFTFRASHLPWQQQLRRFFATNAFGMALNYGLFLLAAHWLPRAPALVVATGISMWVNYGLQRFHVFRHRP